MKRTLPFLVLALCALAAAQDREAEEAWRAWNASLAQPLQDVVTQGSINTHPPRPMSRAEFGVMTWQFIQVAESLGRREPRHEGARGWERPFASNFWRIELLAERHRPVFKDLGYDLQEVDSRLAAARRSLRALHPDVFISVYDRFNDVPLGHWADEAFHNLRRAGILVGYLDNTIRP